MARVWLSKGGASHKAESAGRRLGRSITERCIGVTGHPPVRRMRRYVLRQRRRRGVLVELETRARPSLPLCHARPSQGSDHRLDQALQRRQAALEPRLRTADRMGAQLLSPATASRIAKCPASGGKPGAALPRLSGLALAGSGDLPDTITDRAIVLRMRRRAKSTWRPARNLIATISRGSRRARRFAQPERQRSVRDHRRRVCRQQFLYFRPLPHGHESLRPVTRHRARSSRSATSSSVVISKIGRPWRLRAAMRSR